MKFAIGTLFFGSLVFLLFESTPLDNTLGGDFLFGVASSLGAIVAVFARPYVWKRLQTQPLRKRLDTMALLVMGSAFMTASIASFVNRTFPTGPASPSTFSILWKDTDNRIRQHYLGIEFPFGEERIQVSRKFWQSVPQRGAVRLWFVPGRLGFAYLVGYELAP
jgi:hypothetical protein